jgi:hypothetical protein
MADRSLQLRLPRHGAPPSRGVPLRHRLSRGRRRTRGAAPGMHRARRRLLPLQVGARKPEPER